MANVKDFPINAPAVRLRGGLPKIGIRPAIDGRMGGVREGLEAQTMGMAKAAAQLISTLRHPSGHPVECVIADTCIGGVAEAAACAEKFSHENIAVTITVTPCWCYGSETMDMDPLTIKAIWGFNGTERPGAVYLAAVLAAHAQKGLPAFSIYGHDVQDMGDASIPADVSEKLLRFARAALAAATMRGKSYLAMGNVSMGISGSIVDPMFFQQYLGMRNEYVDMSEFQRRLQLNIFDPEEYAHALAWTKQYCKEGADNNPESRRQTRAQKDAAWETSVKCALIARDLMIGNPKLKAMGFTEESLGHNAIASGFQGQRQWTDFMPNGDFLEAILNSSFDWTGLRAPYIVATENDSLNGVAMLFGHLLTCSAQVFADVRTYWSPDAVMRVTGKPLTGCAKDGIIHLINSGAAALDGSGRQTADGQSAIKPYWDITPDEAEACLSATSWRPGNLPYFRGGGYSSSFSTLGGMPITLARVNLIKGLGPVLQLAEGWTCELESDMHDTLLQRTDPTWPSTWFAPRLNGKGAFTDVYSVMANWGANHGAFCSGHVGADFITLASMLRIPVCMHNVPADKLFRPAAWSAFGTSEPEAADYRACANFGPLYR